MKDVMKDVKGLLLASAAAALFASAPISAEDAPAATEAKVHCGGVNACKNTTECKTASNACKGTNKCAGQGWVSMTEADCKAKGGKVVVE